MRIWYGIRHLIPRALRNEARNLVDRIAWYSWQPLRLQMEEQDRALSDRLDKVEADDTPKALETRMADTNALLSQVLSILEREHSSPPPPPKHLQVRVVGSYVPRFIESGFSIGDELDAILRATGKKIRDFQRILDFGCGCGRMSRALKARAPSSELHGGDIDPEAIAWLKGNYGQFADYRQTPHFPPTPFADSFFDLVLSLSVFTHLPEDMQFSWLEELRRITKPGGYLILTTSGQNNYKNAPPAVQEIMSAKGFFYDDAGEYGQSISLPGFYQNTFHARHYIEREWSKYFEVVDFRPLGVEAHQDATLLRKRS